MSKRYRRSLSAILTLAFVVLPNAACEDEDDIDVLRVVMTALNTQVSNAVATGQFPLSTDEFAARISAAQMDNVTHIQAVYTGRACPTLADDTNNDGFIDAVEGRAVYGDILIPLDNDLTTQLGGNVFPSGSAYEYFRSAPLVVLLNDLRIADPDLNDLFVKLAIGADLALAGRAVVIHGTAATLPNTVRTIGGLTRQQSLPIACGIILGVADVVTT
jgi:hypothetical protein